MRRYVCDKCGKLISRDEADESCAMLRKNMKESDPNIYDVWFWNFCHDCAEKYISENGETSQCNV